MIQRILCDREQVEVKKIIKDDDELWSDNEDVVF